MNHSQIFKIFISGTRKQLGTRLGIEKSSITEILNASPKLNTSTKEYLMRANAHSDSFVIFIVAIFNPIGEFEIRVMGSSPKKRQSRRATIKQFVHAVLVHKLTGSTDIWNHLYQELSK